MSPHFNWYELRTPDAAAAARFYAKVVGWRPETPAGGPMPYTLLHASEGAVAGVSALQSGDAHWAGYVAVDDVDAYAERFRAAGGEIVNPPAEIPGVGRFAEVNDPQGAALLLFRPIPPADGAGPPMLAGPGYPAWRELVTTDGPAAVEFYASMFGWKISTGHDMGPMGVYQLLAYDGEDRLGIMTAPPAATAPDWSFVFGVESAKAAAARIAEAGGTVLRGPMQVPTGNWVVQARDPQGAHFGLHSPSA